MSTLQVKGGSGPAGRTLKTLNNKNNLSALYMKKQLEQLHREQTFSIAHIDRNRFEVHDFLQQIQRKDSDKHPASIKYLGKADLKKESNVDVSAESTPTCQTRHRRRRRKRRVCPEKPKSVTPAEYLVDVEHGESLVSTEKFFSPTERQKTFTIPDRKPSSTFTMLPSLDRRESVYFQIASSNIADQSSDSSDDDEPTLEVKSKELSNRRRSSFNAWVQDNAVDQSKKLQERLFEMKLKDNPLEQRRNSFMTFLQRFKKNKKSITPVDQLHDISETASPGSVGFFQPFQNSYPMDSQTDMMRSIMLNKEQRKAPLNDRIDSFYNRISSLKIPVHSFDGPPHKLTALERRRYTLLTRGIKAALNESSDEDD